MERVVVEQRRRPGRLRHHCGGPGGPIAIRTGRGGPAGGAAPVKAFPTHNYDADPLIQPQTAARPHSPRKSIFQSDWIAFLPSYDHS